MHKPNLTNTITTRRVLPALLSALIMISGSAMAAAPTKNSSPATPHKTVKPKVAPAKPDAKGTSDKAKDAAKEAQEKAATEKEIAASLATATKVDSLDLLKDPAKYMNKKVTFTGTFNRFADIGLDYKKAFRDSRDYVTFFIQRPDVSDHTIPLAELKLFFPRKKSSEVMDLETGDRIQVIGSEFSTALDEPWVDIEHIKILEKTEKHERKHGPQF